MIALYLLCLFFCSPVDPTAAVDYTAVGYDYFVDDPAPTRELPGKQSHSLPQISPTFSVLSCTRHCYCCCYDFNPIQLHSLFLSPLDETAFILCSLLYLYHSVVNRTRC